MSGRPTTLRLSPESGSSLICSEARLKTKGTKTKTRGPKTTRSKSRTPTRINIEDTDGFEVYYKAQVTPRFAVTGDVQLITETLSSEDSKTVAGVRVSRP